MADDNSQRICDYEGSTYRQDFWEGQGRNYEDRVERSVLQRLLPEQGKRLLELGAGFGRLTREYSSFDQVILLDYSFSQLQYAREQLGDDGYIYVAADAYRLPFADGVFDAATMIRVIHHFENVPGVLQQISRVVAANGTFILEHANKRNLKAMLRHKLGRQEWNPDSREPVEFVELNYNFHPDYIVQTLSDAGFALQERVPVSFFRMGVLKQTVPAGVLAGMDRLMQATGWKVSPSIFTRSINTGQKTDNVALPVESIFRCPQSGGTLTRDGDILVSEDGLRWEVRDGIYDFKAPVAP